MAKVIRKSRRRVCTSLHTKSTVHINIVQVEAVYTSLFARINSATANTFVRTYTILTIICRLSCDGLCGENRALRLIDILSR